MSIAEGLIGEFSHEAVTTRKMLERVPEDKLDWKPHEKSMSMGRLGHTRRRDSGVDSDDRHSGIVRHGCLGLQAQDPASKQELLDYFDKTVELFKETMGGQSDDQLFQTWQLKHGGKVAVEMPKVACLRSFIMSHLVHHRGQLSVYLREQDVPIPAIYGPSADESE